MKKIYLFIICIYATQVSAQIDQIASGPGYVNQVYYSLEEGVSISHPHSSWDIAFALGGQDLGIFVNEAVGSSMSSPLPELKLYLTNSTDFAEVDTASMTRLYNNELSWSSGAFNHMGNPEDLFDYGWGSYSPVTHTVTGNKIFALELRDSTWKKLEIQSLISGTYTFRYANLNDSSETVQTINKADFEGKTLAYFSFDAEMTLDLEPANWDMTFTRYYTNVDDNEGGSLNYLVTGVLLNKGVSVAQAVGVDPETVDYNDYEEQYTDSLTAIGYDWKEFDLDIFQWSIPQDRVYFLKNSQNQLWKIQFLDFEGSSTGVSTFQKSLETTVTSLDESFSHLESFTVFPNPASSSSQIAFESKRASAQAKVSIVNSLGQLINRYDVNVGQGLNVKTLSLEAYSAGIYYVTLQVEEDVITKLLEVQ